MKSMTKYPVFFNILSAADFFFRKIVQIENILFLPIKTITLAV